MTASAPGTRGEHGSATAEFAMVLPALVMVIMCVLGAGVAGLTQLRAYEAARSGAREAARGEPHHDIIEAAQRTAGTHAQVTVDEDGSYSTVSVTVRMPESVRFIIPHIEAKARARTESTRTGTGGSP